ncbi:MAG: ribosome biogenesis GTP-binding protein YihA/YsxC [Gammaproteobacteria bacterium]|nr:ribosome biogenesis GTP-binding protein YihA/YsxC [Gammaproteobacteria bacterium]MDP7456129.1 ribosome biogenesis GTP-binding protein YihA/YsxC [Gammaproteobacteria bacterium]HJO11781.1 ribosome biogenesis GTP-binding protein YihA/YsxC [Gammaproteobacteria bacterium]
MNFQETRFAISAAKFTDCPTDSLSEVAFAGRSNAGKSSAINTLTDQSNLARISKTPGRTQLINFFTVEPGRYLVDLPGYGYAKVPLAVKNKWQFELEQYLRKRQSLVGLVLLSDVRHPLKDFDRMMIDWATQSNLPLLLLLTKSDKLKKGPAQNTLLAAKKELGELPDVNVQLFSSLKKTGIKPVLSTLSDWLSPTESKI